MAEEVLRCLVSACSPGSMGDATFQFWAYLSLSVPVFTAAAVAYVALWQDIPTAIALVGGGLVTTVCYTLKAVVGHERLYPGCGRGHAMPSWHAMYSVYFCAYYALSFWRYRDWNYAQLLYRVVSTVTYASLVCASRIQLGAGDSVEVAVGVTLGFTFALMQLHGLTHISAVTHTRGEGGLKQKIEGGNMESAYVFAHIAGAPGCHITLATVAMATEDDIATLRGATQHMIDPLFPCEFRLGNATLVGGPKNITAYKCKPVNPEVTNALRAFYAQHYRGEPGKRLFPTLKLHITVNTEEKLNQVEAFQHSDAKGVFTVLKPMLKIRPSKVPRRPADTRTHICSSCRRLPYIDALRCTHDNQSCYEAPPASAPRVELPAPPPPHPRVEKRPWEQSPQWKCSSCGWENNMSKKECRNSACTQWRPRGAQAVGPRRPGDWTCPGCDDHQFAKNSQCRSCGHPKP